MIIKTIVKKILTLCLSLIIATPTGLFAQAASAGNKTEEDIKQAISSQDKYLKDFSDLVLWGLVIGAVSVISYKAGHFVGDIEGFGRGYKMGKTGLIVAENKRVKKVPANNHFSGKKINPSDYLSSLKATEASSKLDANLLKEFNALKLQLLKLANKSNSNTTLSEMVLRADKQLMALSMAKTEKEFNVLKNQLVKSLADLSGAKITKPSIARKLREYISHIYRKISGKGGLLGISLIAATGTAIILMDSTEASAKTISNKRVFVTRELMLTAETAPDIMLAKVLILKEQYGLDLVSSVIYEKQDKLYAPLAAQIAVAENADSRSQAQAFFDKLSKEKSAEAKEAELLKQLKEEAWTDNFIEGMKNSNGRAFAH